jgi:hypothetical protein
MNQYALNTGTLVYENEKVPGEFLEKVSSAVNDLERPIPETMKSMHAILCDFMGEPDSSKYVTIVRGDRVHLIPTRLLEKYTNLFSFLDINILPPQQGYRVHISPTGECTWYF